MGKRLRHLILVCAVLLSALCGMVNVTFCECHQSFVIGACACEKESSLVTCMETGLTDKGGPVSPSLMHSHHCRHFMMHNDNLEFTATFDVPQLSCIPYFIPVSRYDLGADPLICLGFAREVYYPPDGSGSLAAGGLGYCQPLLI